MSTVDDGLADGRQLVRARRPGVADLRERNRALNREVAELRARLEAYEQPEEPQAPQEADAVDSVPGDEPNGQDAEARYEQERTAREDVGAELAAERARFWEAAGMPGHDGPPPPGVTPEQVRAAALDRAASEGAQPPTEGLEGMYQRLQDRSVSWPQLQREMAAMGFRDSPDATSWGGSTR